MMDMAGGCRLTSTTDHIARRIDSRTLAIAISLSTSTFPLSHRPDIWTKQQADRLDPSVESPPSIMDRKGPARQFVPERQLVLGFPCFSQIEANPDLAGKFRWRPVGQSPVRTTHFVFQPPGFDQLLRFRQALEPVGIQALASEGSVERFAKGVVGWLPQRAYQLHADHPLPRTSSILTIDKAVRAFYC